MAQTGPGVRGNVERAGGSPSAGDGAARIGAGAAGTAVGDGCGDAGAPGGDGARDVDLRDGALGEIDPGHRDGGRGPRGRVSPLRDTLAGPGGRLLLGILLIAAVGLVAGLAAPWLGASPQVASAIYAAGVAPVLLALLVEIATSLRRGEVGLDIVAALSMSGALALGETLAGAVVALMYAGGQFLEAHAEGRAGRRMTALLARAPRVAVRHEAGGRLAEIPLEAVRAGDRLLVRKGDVVPVDGRLAPGAAALLDVAALTGEPLPVRLGPGDQALSGAGNLGEAFDLVAEREASASTFAGVVRLVERARAERAPMARLADRWALIFLGLTLALSAAAWLGSGDPVRALAVLVVATPCPLILAVPVALVSGLSRAAEAGVLVKGAGALERMASIRVLVLDKTGTLTRGAPILRAIHLAPETHDAPAATARPQRSDAPGLHRHRADQGAAKVRSDGDEPPAGARRFDAAPRALAPDGPVDLGARGSPVRDAAEADAAAIEGEEAGAAALASRRGRRASPDVGAASPDARDTSALEPGELDAEARPLDGQILDAEAPDTRVPTHDPPTHGPPAHDPPTHDPPTHDPRAPADIAPDAVPVPSARLDGLDPDTALRLAASLEQASNHVAARALVAAARARGLALATPSDVVERAGEGLSGRVDGRLVDVAGAAPRSGDPPGAVRARLRLDGAPAAEFVLADLARPEAAALLASVRAGHGLRLVLATGDREGVARAVAVGMPFDAVEADLTPADKVAVVAREKADGPVMMLGDGVNDAPALAAADIGIAMGARGAAASAEAADAVVLVDRLQPVADALAVARRTRSIALQSVVLGISLSVLGMIAAALGHLDPVQGALLQEAIDVAAILNALRALRGGPGEARPVGARVGAGLSSS